MEEVRKSAILAARALIEKDPAYSYVTARLLLHTHPRRGARRGGDPGGDGDALRRILPGASSRGIDAELLDERLAQFDLQTPGRGAGRRTATCKFTYLGLQTLYDRYFLHVTAASASNCRRRSSCAWRWAWR